MSETTRMERNQQELGPRDLVPWGYAPGNYMIICADCGDHPLGADKRAYRCERCAMIARYKTAEKKLEELSYLTA